LGKSKVTVLTHFDRSKPMLQMSIVISHASDVCCDLLAQFVCATTNKCRS